MQTLHISPGSALCRFCGETVSTNSLSKHIAAKHPRPRKKSLAPTLVRKPKAAPPTR